MYVCVCVWRLGVVAPAPREHTHAGVAALGSRPIECGELGCGPLCSKSVLVGIKDVLAFRGRKKSSWGQKLVAVSRRKSQRARGHRGRRAGGQRQCAQ